MGFEGVGSVARAEGKHRPAAIRNHVYAPVAVFKTVVLVDVQHAPTDQVANHRCPAEVKSMLHQAWDHGEGSAQCDAAPGRGNLCSGDGLLIPRECQVASIHGSSFKMA